MATSSSGSSNSKDFEDFISEVQDIEKSTTQDDSGDDDTTKTPDEGEQEAAWLKDAGFPHLASNYEEGRELKDDDITRETSSLTRAQAAAVKKRVDTLNATLRKKQKQKEKQKADVRNIFTPPEIQTDGGSQKSDSGTLSPDEEGKIPPRVESFRPMGRNRGGYSMTGGHNVMEPTGIETISIQSRAHPGSKNAPPAGGQPQGSGPAVSEGDIALNFAVADAKVSPVPRRHQTENKETTDKHGLPNFVLVKDVLGITNIENLSEADVRKVRNLALIELTALYDTNNITYSRRKHKKRLKDHGVYGVPLQTLVEHDQKKWPHLHLKVPRIFLELVHFLERTGIQEEGILRVPGSIARIKSLREEIEKRFNSDHFSWEEVWCNDAAGLLKQFIRELPAPLLSFEYLEAFAQVEKIPDRMQQLQALNLLVLLLPDVHRKTLEILLDFLKKVVDNEGNKMTANNVAMIMAPNLFLVSSGKKSTSKDKQVEFHLAAGTATIVKMLIKYQYILWTVPSFMMQQVRHQYENDQMRKAREKTNSIMKFWGKKDKSDPYKKPVIQHESDYQEGVIRVQVPHLTSYHTGVQLNAATTATDVIQKFHRRSFVTQASVKEPKNNKQKHAKGDVGIPQDASFSVDTMSLYEFGGNIGERKLDPNTNMLALLRVNPNAEWIIRPNKPD